MVQSTSVASYDPFANLFDAYRVTIFFEAERSTGDIADDLKFGAGQSGHVGVK